MFNEMIVVSATPFRGTSSPDKNGKYPVMLQLIAGKMPNRNVMSGTVAELAGVEIGRTYLMNVRENGFDKVFGPDFTFIKVKELTTGKDIIDACKELSKPEMLTVTRPAGFEDVYKRKTSAVEGVRNHRIQSGDYIPAITSSSFEHETAGRIIEGSSNRGASHLSEQDLKNALNAGEPGKKSEDNN